MAIFTIYCNYWAKIYNISGINFADCNDVFSNEKPMGTWSIAEVTRLVTGSGKIYASNPDLIQIKLKSKIIKILL